VVSVNFIPSTYGVNEGDMARLMVVLSAPSDMEVTVVVRTTPDTASGKKRGGMIKGEGERGVGGSGDGWRERGIEGGMEGERD
jgi:hypothetical protein